MFTGALEEESDRESETLTEKQRHQLKHRELFLSREIETLAATQIRGKCTVTLLNETESLSSYLSKDDTFFYTLVYDSSQKTLLADRGEIRVGSRFQAEVPQRPLEDPSTSDGRNLDELEILEYTNENDLNESEIDSFLMIAKSVGTFARALDHNSTIKQPSLHMSAATASRDVTIATAMKILHKCNYNIAKAVLELVPSSGPLLCRDEMEEWSASEANLFEEAMEKYGKDFGDIRQDFVSYLFFYSLIYTYLAQFYFLSHPHSLVRVLRCGYSRLVPCKLFFSSLQFFLCQFDSSLNSLIWFLFRSLSLSFYVLWFAFSLETLC